MIDPNYHHTGNTIEAFSAVVLLVPGEKPEIVLTPRIVVPAHDRTSALTTIAAEVAGRHQQDLAAEIRRRVEPLKETA